MAVKKKGLGRGFDAIFADNAVEEISSAQSAVKVKLSDIEPNRNQPRKNFDEEALAELGEDVPEFNELWDEELTEEECLVLIDRFKEKMEEEGE